MKHLKIVEMRNLQKSKKVEMRNLQKKKTMCLELSTLMKILSMNLLTMRKMNRKTLALNLMMKVVIKMLIKIQSLGVEEQCALLKSSCLSNIFKYTVAKLSHVIRVYFLLQNLKIEIYLLE